MEKALYDTYLAILKEELVPAMGCTEPIAVAYAAALAARALGCPAEQAEVAASANIIKNVKSVVVPHTGGRRGIAAAAAAGIVAGDADKELEVLCAVTEDDLKKMADFLEKTPIHVERSGKPYLFDIQVRLFGGGHTAFAEIAGHHTNVIALQRDGEVLLQKEYVEQTSTQATDHTLLNVEQIVQFADEADLNDVKETLQRQIDCNTAIAKQGLEGHWGAEIGRILLRSYGDSVHNRAKAWAAAGSDARMNGCELPVVINSGSGNQGLTASLPVIIYARDMGASRELLYRALLVSNLVTIHLKTGIGPLSAYCGATSAGCGAGAGITYLHGGRYDEIAHTVVNALAINSGMVCDGAKASCAAKIASAVEAGLLGMQMQMHDSEFVGGDGIVLKGVENTIRNVSKMAHDGMALGEYIAGMGFSNVGLGIVHSMAHGLSALYDTPHGVACAILLPVGLEYNKSVAGERYRAVGKAMGVKGMDEMNDAQAADATIAAVKQLSADVGIPANLHGILKEEDIQFLAESAYADACRPGNPRDTSVEEIVELYKSQL